MTLGSCSTAADWNSTTKETRSITVESLTTENSIAYSRGYFYFKFSSSNEILDYSKFTIDLSLLATANSAILSNLRCFAYKSDEISHDFAKFEYSTFSAINLEYKTKDTSSLVKPYIFSSISYTFKCFGS